MKYNLKPKHVVTALLLTFIIVSVSYAAFREMKQSEPIKVPDVVQATVDSINTQAPTNNAASSESVNPAPTPQSNTIPKAQSVKPAKIMAYYFHATARCKSCRTIEKYSFEVITSKYKKELDSKLLEWQSINVEELPNEHYIQDYQLKSMSLVLVKKDADGQTSWKNLEGVWHHLDDKQAFHSYVETELNQMLRQSGS